MAGFEHGGAYTETVEEAQGANRRARVGLVLFVLYCLLYAGYMGLSAFSPKTMRIPALGGVNLAIAYGFGLILAALFLAFLYGWLCRTPAEARAK